MADTSYDKRLDILRNTMEKNQSVTNKSIKILAEKIQYILDNGGGSAYWDD